MKKVWHAWNKISLVLRIICGMVIGGLLALAIPGIDWLGYLGDFFVSALKAVAPVVVFFLVISALANAKANGSMKSIILLYVLSMVLAALVAVGASVLFPSTIAFTGIEAADVEAPSGISQVLHDTILKCFSNPVEALAGGNFLGILVWAIGLGVVLRKAKDTTKDVFTAVADGVNSIVRVVIAFAPFGVLGIVYASVSSNGLDIFETFGHLIVVLVVCMLIVALITNPLLAGITMKGNPFPLVWRCLKGSAVTAFFTRSSAANIPVNMELCEKLGLEKDTYSVSIPLGATINMAGATVTISVMALAAAHTLGISVDFPTALLLCVLSAVGACGSAGVAGGSLMLIPLACALFGISPDISAQVIAVGMVIGVIQDSCETALNSSSDVLFTAAVDRRRAKALARKQGAQKDEEQSA